VIRLDLDLDDPAATAKSTGANGSPASSETKKKRWFRRG